jgi:orotate phosphoribosyltransferase
MSDPKAIFLQNAMKYNALKFGEYTLKSGRISPYFFNIGLLYSGEALSGLGAAYADAIVKSGVEFDVIFGPAYKGIPLAALTAAKLADIGGEKWRSVEFAYNRKVSSW